MEHGFETNPQQKEAVKETDDKPLTPKEVGVPQKTDKSAEKKLDNPQGAGGRVVRGPFGVQ